MTGQVLGHLLAKAESDAWNPGEVVDWDRKIIFPFWYRRRTYIRLISQFYHGEVMVCRMLEELIPRIEEPDHRRFLELQMAEELRHAELFQTYIKRMGELAPVEPALEQALEESRDWPGSPLGLITAFHVVFEGGVVGVMEKLGARLPCPLFRQINSRVVIDEARHFAFGVDYLRQGVQHLPAAEKAKLHEWIRALWARCAVETQRRYTWPVALVSRMGSDWLEESWKRQDEILRRTGISRTEERPE